MKSAAVQPKHFPWFDYSRYSFSLGIDAGAHVYLSGHTASEYDPDVGRMVVKGNIGAQTRTAYAKIGAILEGAGKTYADVVRIVEYVRPEGIERYEEAAAVRNEVFGAHRPTVNTVPVKSPVAAGRIYRDRGHRGSGSGRKARPDPGCRRHRTLPAWFSCRRCSRSTMLGT